MRKYDVTDNERAENFWQAKYDELYENTMHHESNMAWLQKENDELRERMEKLASRAPTWPKNYRPSRLRKFA